MHFVHAYGRYMSLDDVCQMHMQAYFPNDCLHVCKSIQHFTSSWLTPYAMLLSCLFSSDWPIHGTPQWLPAYNNILAKAWVLPQLFCKNPMGVQWFLHRCLLLSCLSPPLQIDVSTSLPEALTGGVHAGLIRAAEGDSQGLFHTAPP